MIQTTALYPEFMRMVEIVSSQNPLQKKRIHNFIAAQDQDYWNYAEDLCRSLGRSFLKTPAGREAVAGAFNRMTMDFLKEQIRFKKTGVYLLNDATVARENVYDRPEVMRYYMLGLLLSYLLWPNHFKMMHFFRKYLPDLPKVRRYLDVAPGHGLFAVETMQKFPQLKAELLDISKTSIEVTREILATFEISPERFEFINGDFLTVPIKGKDFDFISMGEVLEHVNDAPGFMKRAHDLLSPEGKIFMTTCTNAPALDHIYHFHNTQEIRDLLYKAGLRIVKEEALPAEDFPEELCQAQLVTVNYCCILERQK